MTTEYNCSCHIDGKTYNLVTMNCPLLSQAQDQFEHYVLSEGGEWEFVDGLVMDKVEVEG